MSEHAYQKPASGHRFDPTIFREYDIRGVVGQTLGPQDAYLIARAFASKVSQVAEGGVVCVQG